MLYESFEWNVVAECTKNTQLLIYDTLSTKKAHLLLFQVVAGKRTSVFRIVVRQGFFF